MVELLGCLWWVQGKAGSKFFCFCFQGSSGRERLNAKDSAVLLCRKRQSRLNHTAGQSQGSRQSSGQRWLLNLTSRCHQWKSTASWIFDKQRSRCQHKWLGNAFGHPLVRGVWSSQDTGHFTQEKRRSWNSGHSRRFSHSLRSSNVRQCWYLGRVTATGSKSKLVAEMLFISSLDLRLSYLSIGHWSFLGLQILKKLIDQKVKIDVEDFDQRNPLIWAASSGESSWPLRYFSLESSYHCLDIVWRKHGGSRWTLQSRLQSKQVRKRRPNR